MKTSWFIAAAIVSFVSNIDFAQAGPSGSINAGTLDTLAREATSVHSPQASAAIEQLRAAGPAGLDAMFEVYAERIEARQNVASAKDPNWEQLRAALDTIAQQRDSYTSHLYWFTDLEKAKSAARAAGKPILSLRLLGKLNEEFTCANSRFFRTTLYPNAEVSRYLRDHFILHWQSARPVPRITIDMGDGRRIERTITGNSIHYVLDADGNPIDALPGLYGPQAFLAELNHAVTAEQQAFKLSGSERAQYLTDYHAARLAEIHKQWSSDLAKIGDTSAPAPEAMDSEAVWQKIAALHSAESVLDPNAVRLIESKQPPTAAEAARITMTKMAIETPMIRTLRNLQRSIAEDTVRNEYQLHSRIHEWFVNGAAPANLAALNSKIYAELFLTPNSDPWLGLAPSDVYSALDAGGLVQTKAP
jgi:hypothetical protein